MQPAIITALVVCGAGVALIPGLPVIELLLGIQVLNGVLLPIILIFILRLINDERLTGDLKNGRVNNLLAWGTVALITTAVIAMFALQAAQWLGGGQ